MRILLVTTSYPSSASDPSGHFVESEALGLAQEGHSVTVVTGAGDVQGEERRDPVTVLRLPSGGAMGWPGIAARVGERPLRAAGLAWWLHAARAAVKERAPFDRIVAHWSVPSGWPIAFETTGDLTLVSHGGDVRLLVALPAALRGRLVRALSARASKWRFVSGALLEKLASSLSAAERAAVDRIACVEAPAIDMPDVTGDILRLRAARTTRPLYASVGRLVSGKRVDLVIDYVAQRDDAPELVIVGDGPERRRLEARARDSRVDARFVGRTSRREALAWIGAADALVHASRDEGLSTVLREAEALGTRIVRL